MTDTQPSAADDDLTGTTWRDVRSIGDRAHVRHLLRRGDDSEWRVTFDGDHGLYVYPGSIIRAWTRVHDAEPAEDDQWEVERLKGQLADALHEIERLTAGREIEQEMLRNAGAEMATLIDERDEARRDRDRFAQTIEYRVKELDEARAHLANARRDIEALADALTEDNAYDDAALMGPHVSVSEAQTYPAIISERTGVIQRLRAILEPEPDLPTPLPPGAWRLDASPTQVYAAARAILDAPDGGAA